MSKPRVDVHSPISALLEQRAFLRRLARTLVRDASAADDLEQDTWIAALKRPPRSSQSAMAWIASTTRRIAGKLRRSGERRQQREFANASPEHVDGDENAIHRLELQHSVVAALLALEEPYRTAITLRYLDDESPSRIAERLGLPLNTVRAHLRRGLERLRIRLDAAAGGDRRAWCLALAPLATAPLASASIASGVVAMGTKSMIGGGLVAATALLSATLWFDFDEAPPTAQTPAALASAPVTPRTDAAPPSPDAIDAPVTSHREAAVADPVVLPDPGTVEFEVVDARTGAPIPDAGVRMLNASRFAEWTGSGAGELTVTAGAYDVTAFARGYETLTRAGVVVDAHGAASLGQLALERGSGTIHGTAHVTGIATPGPITIELYGRGRRWCDACDHGVVRTPRVSEAATDGAQSRSITDGATATIEQVAAFDESPCTTCGYRDDRSEITIEPGQRFAFHGLAQGTYVVRARNDEHSPFPTQEVVTLARGRDVWVDFTLAVGVDVELALTGPDGAPFDGSTTVAADDGTRIVQSPIYFTFDEERDDAFEATWTPGLDLSPVWSTRASSLLTARGAHVAAAVGANFFRIAGTHVERRLVQFDLAGITIDEPPSATTPGSPAMIRGLLTKLHGLDLATADRSDRAREPHDEPAPTALDATPPPSALEATATAPGQFLVRRVPPRFLSAIVRCGPLGSAPVVVDTRGGSPGIIAVALRRIVCDTAASANESRVMVESSDSSNRRVTWSVGTGPRPQWDPRTTTCTDCHERR